MLGLPTGTLTSKFFTYLSSVQTTYIALHTGTASAISPGANEIGTRQRVYWTVSNNVASNTSDVTFTGLSTSNISYITINDSLTAGNVLFMIPLLTPYNLTVTGSTGIYTLKANTIFLNFESNTSTYAIDGGYPATVWTTPTVAIGDGGTP
jgi:hypothetical protein